MAHAGVGQQLAPYEKMTQIDGAAVLGKGRAGYGEITAQFIEQGVGGGADVAGIG